jgi:type II secretory pathway pseudopilin PulG
MILPPYIKARSAPGRAAGFTLVETMVSMGIYVVILIGTLVALQVFGLRVYTLGATKLSATSSALKVLNHVRDDIRGAKTVNVGNVTTSSDPASFTLTGPTNKNIGNALQIFPSTNLNSWTVYYLDSSTATNYLKMSSTVNGTSFSTPISLASYITNSIVFTAEDCRQNILTNDSFNRVIRMELDFYQWEYPVGFVGGAGANAYDFYRLTTRITCRQID